MRGKGMRGMWYNKLFCDLSPIEDDAQASC